MINKTFKHKIEKHNQYGKYANLRQHFIDCMNMLIKAVNENDTSAIEYAHEIIGNKKVLHCSAGENMIFNRKDMIFTKQNVVLYLTNWLDNFKKGICVTTNDVVKDTLKGVK